MGSFLRLEVYRNFIILSLVLAFIASWPAIAAEATAPCPPDTEQADARIPPLHPAISPPPILSRNQWGAKPPALKMTAHQPKTLTIHHTGERQNPKRSLEFKMKSLQSFSQRQEKLASGKIKPVWPDVPYHFYIDLLGGIAEGREVGFVGDTNTDYDPTGHILVVVEGNFDTENPSEAQSKSLLHLLAFLAVKHGISSSTIEGHQHHASTACPGKALLKRIPEIQRQVGQSLSTYQIR